MVSGDLLDMTADRDSWSDQASDVLRSWDEMREDRDRLAARLAAIQALCDEWEREWEETSGIYGLAVGIRSGLAICINGIHAVLDASASAGGVVDG